VNTRETWLQAKLHTEAKGFPVHELNQKMGAHVKGYTPCSGGWYDVHEGSVGKKKRNLQIKLNPECPDIKKFIDTLEYEADQRWPDSVMDQIGSYDGGFSDGISFAITKFKEMLIEWEESEHGNQR
jgi:hypothetical protein